MAEPNRLAAALSYEQDRPAFGNPSMLEQGRKMRERKQAEQVDRSAQKVKSDLLARALMRRYNPETLTGLTDTPGPQTLDEAAGLDPRVDRSTFLPYSQKEGLHVPAVAADLMKLATASNPQYSNLMQPEEAMPLATNMMGGGVVASRLAPAPAGSLGMNVIGQKKQALINAGFYHPIGGGKKLPMPVGDMKFTTVENAPKVDQRVISPESMQGGTLVPAIGDRTAAGAMLYDVGGHPLASPVQLEGGADFMRTHAPHGSAWASDKGVITALAKKVRAAGEVGDVYMPHVAMSHTSGDFSKMMSDALLEQMKSSTISKTAKLEFDRNMRRVRPEWKGIDHPEALNQLNSNGAVRTAFVAEANLDQFANRGFPNVAHTRVAITDPNLMNVPIHSSGYTVAKMNPQGLVINDPVAPHSTYSTQLGGEYVGGFAQPIPRDVMFPNFAAKRRALGADTAGDMRSFQLSNPTQSADQQWLDGVMNYLKGK